MLDNPAQIYFFPPLHMLKKDKKRYCLLLESWLCHHWTTNVEVSCYSLGRYICLVCHFCLCLCHVSSTSFFDILKNVRILETSIICLLQVQAQPTLTSWVSIAAYHRMAQVGKDHLIQPLYRGWGCLSTRPSYLRPDAI